MDRAKHITEGRQQPSSDGYRELVTGLASVLERVGGDGFYDSLAEGVAQFFGCNRWLVIRYARYAKPKFLVNRSMTEQAVASYLKTFYRIDPLLRMVRRGTSEAVITFDELRQNAQDTLFHDEMFNTARIRDELVFLLPAIGGVSIALCLDRGERGFSSADTAQARDIHATLDQLHRLHVNQSLRASTGYTLEQSDAAMMILDAGGHILFRTADWITNITPESEADFVSAAGRSAQGSRRIAPEFILHWETLAPSNAIAPGGTCVVFEHVSPGYMYLPAEDWRAQFAISHDLTQREVDIVSRLLTGEPTARIADALSISAGTVRNHKHRLYSKLDITSERELFCMIFDDLVRRQMDVRQNVQATSPGAAPRPV
ncbi:MAG: LuxR C-terminal-related transcriptional regulator [Pseudomonadota bacterium]